MTGSLTGTTEDAPATSQGSNQAVSEDDASDPGSGVPSAASTTEVDASDPGQADAPAATDAFDVPSGTGATSTESASSAEPTTATSPDAEPGTAATPDPSADAEPAAPSDTPIFDSTVQETGTDPSPSLETSGSTSSDEIESPVSESSEPTPEPSSQAEDEEPEWDAPSALEPTSGSELPSSENSESDKENSSVTPPPSDSEQPTTDSSPEPSPSSEETPTGPVYQSDEGNTATGEKAAADEYQEQVEDPEHESSVSVGSLNEGDALPDIVVDDDPVVSPVFPDRRGEEWLYSDEFRAHTDPLGNIGISPAGWVGPEALVFRADQLDDLRNVVDRLIEERDE